MRSAEVPDGFKLIAPLIFGKRPKKRILGTELSGVIVEIGKQVMKWKVGDAVFAFPGGKQGAHAEFIRLPENGPIALKPDSLSFEESAALCFGGSTALSFIEKGGGIREGEEVLVIGASGSVGSATVQLAKHYGAQVTGVSSTANLELVKSLGADHVVDYKREDFVEGGERYDVVMDTTATAPISRCKRVLKKGGRILLVNGAFGELLRSPFILGAKVVAGPAKEDPAHLAVLADLAEAGAYRPLIDSTFPFEEIVAAHRRVDSGRKKGNVVVKVRPSLSG
jgi:NADPH:quinone reductase-like Zn-dependent oxidoreductase